MKTAIQSTTFTLLRLPRAVRLPQWSSRFRPGNRHTVGWEFEEKKQKLLDQNLNQTRYRTQIVLASFARGRFSSTHWVGLLRARTPGPGRKSKEL